MKRLNLKTGKPFKQGDKREGGFVFFLPIYCLGCSN